MQFTKTIFRIIFNGKLQAGILLFSSLVFMICLTGPVEAKKSLPDKYPRVGNYFLDPEISQAEAEELAQWDLVILGFDTQYNSPDAFATMRKINPDIIILAYVTSEEVPVKHLDETDKNSPVYQLYHQLLEKDEWFLKNTSNDYVNFYPGTRMINVTTAWKKVLPKFITQKVLKKYPKKWDGVFYDNCFNDVSWVDNNIDVNQDNQADFWKTADKQWKRGMNTIMKQTRKRNKTKFIMCNSNGEYYTNINGRMIEAFPSEFDGNWTGSMKQYFNVLNTAKRPSMVIVNTVANSDDSANYKKMRFNLTSTLMGDGFASFDESVDRHASLWWYDEYSVALGNPLSGAYNVETNEGTIELKDGVWRRNFQRGIVIVNSSSSSKRIVLEDGFEKILGTQDVETNNGKVVGAVTLESNDGIVLLGRVTQVTDAPFINGTLAKVFNARGKTRRNNFFTYNSQFSGGDTVVYLEDVNTSVVAGDTYVTVYKNGRKTARFAPYGESFTGGVNIDVDRLQGKNKAYRIVTGTQNYGPHVRIFSLSGTLVNPGCFPYDKVFGGGVNVAIGDVVQSNGGKEIVVAAAHGGGPHVRILNYNCQLISPGFFAYDQSMRSGVSVAAGDVDNDGKDDIVTVPGDGSPAYVRIFNSRGHATQPGFYAFSQSDKSGASVAVSDVDGDGINELVAMSFSIFNE